MPKYCFTLFFSFAFALCSFSQHSQLSYLDGLIEKNKNETSETALAKSFQTAIENSKSTIERTDVEVVYNALLARLYFAKEDLRNVQSDSLYKLAVSKSLQSGYNISIWVNTQYGFYLYSNSLYKDALPYFLTTSRLIDKYGNDLRLQATDVLKKNSFFFGSIKDYARAIDYTKKALERTDKKSFEYGALLNTLGRNYEAIGNRNLAEEYYNETLEISKANGDNVRYAKALGDLALLFIADNNLQKAEDYLLEDIAISKANDAQRNVMYAQIQLGKLYCKTKRHNEAIAVLREAERYANSKLYLKNYEKQIVELKLAIAIAQKDEDLELLYRRQLDTIGLQVSKTDSDDIINTINLEVQNENIKLQLSAEKKNLQNELLVKKLTIVIGVVLFLLLILLFVMHKNKLQYQQTEFEQKILSFEIDKINSDTKLKETNYSLESYKKYLLEKNQQVEELEKEIATKDSSITSVHNSEDYQKIQHSHLLTEDNWQQFKKEFIKEQNDFYKRTLQKYPTLTESNLRLVMLIKMGFTNPNIANLLGVTLDGVKKAKQRLKKKYDDILNDL